MLLFLIRHGDPIYNPDSLTPLGHRQAEAVAKRLALYGIDRIYSSTSERARLTSLPTCELLHKEPTLLEWCREGGAWQELSVEYAEGKRRWAFQDPEMSAFFNTAEIRELGMNWHTHPRFAGMPISGGVERIRRDADEFFASLGYVHEPENNRYRVEKKNNERIALFAHQGFGLAFLSCVLDIPYPFFCTHFDLSHSSMTVIEFIESDGFAMPKILSLSNDSHLFREGLPTNYNNRLLF